MNRTRAKTSISTDRTSRLPDLNSPKDSGSRITQDKINNIKLKTQQLELERKQMKSKTAYMKALIKDRNNKIQSVYTQPNDNRNIKTASKNQLLTLEETAKSLERSLNERKKQLDEIEKSDKLAVSKELQIEIQMYYLEQKHLAQSVKTMKDKEAIIAMELNRLKRQAASAKANEDCIDDLQAEIDGLTEKLFAYNKSELRNYSTKQLKIIHDNPNELENIRKSIEEKIKNEGKEMEKNRRKCEKIQQKENDNIQYLQQIIDQQAQKIQEALDKMNQKDQPEEEESKEPEEKEQPEKEDQPEEEPKPEEKTQ